ncbi:MAG: response regulator [Chloroflexi bacterium]|nr:response regulator [Chloroflexota bacterium]
MSHLQEALSHLHDPDYEPPQALIEFVGLSTPSSALEVQATISRKIEELRPVADVPRSARSRRSHGILHNRFVLKLTVEETAERMAMGASSVRRAQREAVHWLASHLLEDYVRRRQNLDDHGTAPDSRLTAKNTPDVRAQVEQELASLQVGAPGAIARVDEVVSAAVRLETVVGAARGVNLVVSTIDAELAAAVHPSALRQALVMSLGQLIEWTAGHEVRIRASSEDTMVVLELSCQPPADGQMRELTLVREIIDSRGGTVQVAHHPDELVMRIEVPEAGDVTVLVIDDNTDVVYFYQRCTEGTRYHIVHHSEGRHVFDAVAASDPALIIVDIMLPDIDGWELLTNLHNHPLTRHIPVLVCSVIHEANLALALGAVLCVRKPVSHRDFIQALDWVMERVGSIGQAAQASSGGPDSATDRPPSSPRP